LALYLKERAQAAEEGRDYFAKWDRDAYRARVGEEEEDMERAVVPPGPYALILAWSKA
jgi:hypothetical protein